MMQKLKAFAKALKAEIAVLASAIRDPRTPWTAKLLGIAVVAYAVSPIDLIPDFIPVLGQLDELILLPLGVALAMKLTPRPLWEARLREAEASAEKLPRFWWGALLIVAVWAVLLGLFVWWLWRTFAAA